MNYKNAEGFIVKWYSIFYLAPYFIRRGLYKAVRDLAPVLEGNLLDFGCGSKPYKHLFTRATSYIGLDIAVSGHSHENEQIDVFYDGKVIPFEDGSFESVFATEVFEHVFNIDEVLPEIKRVLKTGGYLLVTCPFTMPEHERPYDFARYTSFGIKHIFEKHGFQIIDQRKTGNYLESVAQLIIFYLNYLLPKKPYILYLVLFQIFILPINIVTSVLSVILPKKAKRDDLYLNNVVLVKKI